jgi:hypothetical protein
MQIALEQNRIGELMTPQTEDGFGTKIGIIGKLLGCWHKQLSRPFSNKNFGYRTCLECGARKRFDAQNLKTFGPFYYPPIVKSIKK